MGSLLRKITDYPIKTNLYQQVMDHSTSLLKQHSFSAYQLMKAFPKDCKLSALYKHVKLIMSFHQVEVLALGGGVDEGHVKETFKGKNNMAVIYFSPELTICMISFQILHPYWDQTPSPRHRLSLIECVPYPLPHCIK